MVYYIDRHYILICSHNYKQCNFDIFQCLDQNCYYQLKVTKDTHREKEPSNKTPTLTKSTNMGIWIVGTKNPLLWEVLKLKQDFQKNKTVTSKTLFFVIGPFCSHHSNCLTLTTDMTLLYGNDAFSILLLLTKKGFSSYLSKLFVFQKMCFKVKVLKTFKISTDCHIKNVDLSNEGPFWKALVSFFIRTYALSVVFKMKPRRNTAFRC